MGTITDISFPAIFESLNTGRESSGRVLQNIIEGLLEGGYQPDERILTRQLAETLQVSIAARADNSARLRDNIRVNTR